ncbi:collagen alpha-1(IX) chain-like Protein [Elysia marginata]|uniref:Collagen alpha-1(IX) chain-like Protein n=1 Tax=Elysia marginata TaxID=1093978 RepID=A0AAV4FAN2_9GAST|nr:collagen alpha-1(IX) chain-like Protein [Elysia marginata]
MVSFPTGFDFISNYGLDRSRRIPGVVEVPGTNEFQRAYRIDRSARLFIPTRDLFPNGLPQEFSFVSTFRMLEDTRRERWSLFEVRDRTGRPQFGVTLDGGTKNVEMFFTNFNGEIERLAFNRRSRRIFNRNWHKIHFSVTRDNVEMYIDCKPIFSQPLPPRLPVDLDGNIVMATRESDGATVPADYDDYDEIDPEPPVEATTTEKPEIEEVVQCLAS